MRAERPELMDILRFRLLGIPCIELGGEPVLPRRRKTAALLYYLAASCVPTTRGPAAGLLWPEFAPDHARGSLRRALMDANEAAGSSLFEPGRDLLRFAKDLVVNVDAVMFLELASQGLGCRIDDGRERLLRAAELYGGDFLSGFYLKDALEYEDWQFSQVELYREKAIRILDRLARAYRAEGRCNKAGELVDRMLRIAPLDEAGHRLAVEMLADRGQASAARAHYEAYAAALYKELGAKPEHSFARFYELLREGRHEPVPESPDDRRGGRNQPWPVSRHAR